MIAEPAKEQKTFYFQYLQTPPHPHLIEASRHSEYQNKSYHLKHKILEDSPSSMIH